MRWRHPCLQQLKRYAYFSESVIKLMSLNQFFDIIVGKRMCEYLKKMEFSSLFVLACGAVVQVKEAQEGLRSVVKK